MKRTHVLAVTLALLGWISSHAVAQQAPTVSPSAPPAAARVSVPLPSQTSSLTSADVQAWLDGFLPYALQRANIAGAVVVVVKDGQVLLQKGYGYADVAKRTPVSPEATLFRPGSVSKLFTWTAVMQQVEQGRIDLDRDVNTSLDFKIPDYQGKPVTMRELMTHTGGFEEDIKNLIAPVPARMPSLGDALKRDIPARIFPPGQVPAYSNFGAALAGYIVERTSGQPFDAYVEQHIFAPLGMHHSSFRQPLPAALLGQMSNGYEVGTGDPKPYEEIALAPAGSSAVTGSDMARFMIAHLQNGEYQGQRILQTATAHEMHDTPLTIIPSLDRMLLGFYEVNRNGHRIIGHEGDTAWFHSELDLFIDHGVGFFISLNSAGNADSRQAIRVALLHGFADRYFPGPAASGPVQASSGEDAAKLVGTYYSSRRPETNFLSLLNLLVANTVSTDSGHDLVASPSRDLTGTPTRFRQVGPLLWRAMGEQDRLAAKLQDGRVAMWSEDGFSPFEVYLPAPWYKNPSFLLPAMEASVAVLLLTGIFWPVAAVVRWRYGATSTMTGAAVRSYRWMRVAALASALLMLAWVADVMLMITRFAVTDALDPLILTLHVLSIIVFPLAVLSAIWNVRASWRNRAGFAGVLAKGWNAALVLSTLVLLWIAALFHLIGIGVTY